MIILEQSVKIEKDEVEAYEDNGWKVTKGSDGNYYAEKPSNNKNQQSSQENKKAEKSPKKEQCPSTPFKNSTESDAFRTWLLGKYPEYEKKRKPYDVNQPPQPKYTNTTALRCAYKDKGNEYEEFLKKKPEDTKLTNTDTQNQENIRQQELAIQKEYELKNCAPWEDMNNFEQEFPGEEDIMAKDYINFILKSGRFVDKGSSYNIGRPMREKGRKGYSLCKTKHDDYVKKGESYKSPWLRDIVDYTVPWDGKYITSYDAWKTTLGGLKENSIKKKNLIEKVIKSKLKEKMRSKKLNENIKSKLNLKSKKVDVISENLYKVAGKFYNENYNEFFKKFEKLTENYKKSKLFLKEDSSESFNRALNKVFKGDEEKLKKEAIPFFMNKLGLEGAIRTQVENELDKKYGADNVGDMFLDCWADIVVQSFKDNAKSEITEPSNVMDAIEKIMVSKIDSPEFDYQLKKEICKMLKPAQEERQTKVQDLAKKLAQSIIDSSEA